MITLKDLRTVIRYVCQNEVDLQDVSDEKLLEYDFVKDLNIGNIRLINIAIQLQQVHNFQMPFEVLRTRPDDTVKSFLDTVNRHISEKL